MEPGNLVLRHTVPIKTLPHSPISAEFWNHGVLSGAIQRYAVLAERGNKNNKILWKSNPQPVALTAAHFCAMIGLKLATDINVVHN